MGVFLLTWCYFISAFQWWWHLAELGRKDSCMAGDRKWHSQLNGLSNIELFPCPKRACVVIGWNGLKCFRLLLVLKQWTTADGYTYVLQCSTLHLFLSCEKKIMWFFFIFSFLFSYEHLKKKKNRKSKHTFYQLLVFSFFLKKKEFRKGF